MDDKQAVLNEIKGERQKTFETSWYELYHKENSTGKDFENVSDDPTNVQIKIENVENAKDEREFELELLDTSNEDKLTRLIIENKVKTPFKRRHSNSSSNSGECGKTNEMNRKFSNGANTKKSRKHEKPRNQSTSSHKSNAELEKDPLVLARRQKQIDYGKNTIGYENYIKAVPKNERTHDHPKTPNKYQKYSRRGWEGVVKVWRKKLHIWDDEDDAENEDGMSDDNLSDDNAVELVDE